MALEEKDVQGSGEQEQPKQLSVEQTSEKNMFELIQSMQAKIERLEQEKNSVPAQSSNEQADLLKQLVSELKGTPNLNAGFDFAMNYVGEHEIDPDDALETKDWVVFISHSVGHVIVDDMRNGRPVRVPYGKIEFRYDSTKRVPNGKEVDLYNISKYTCKSKKELAWLKAHTKYGILFFDNIKGARTVDASRALKLAHTMRGLQSMGQMDIVAMARAHDIQMGADINLLRAQIATKLVDEQIDKEIMISKARVNEANLEALVIGKQVQE